MKLTLTDAHDNTLAVWEMDNPSAMPAFDALLVHGNLSPETLAALVAGFDAAYPPPVPSLQP